MDESANKMHFLFAAIPSSDPIQKITKVIELASLLVVGIVVLPVEVAPSLSGLLKKNALKDASDNEWTVFIGQQSSTSIRQIVMHKDGLSMTRVTPVADYSYDNDAWVEDVQQDIKTTIGYLSRLGYSSEFSKTNIIVIGDPDSSKKIEERLKINCTFYNYSVEEATSRLKLKIDYKSIAEEHIYSAQVLHAALINAQSTYNMNLNIPQVKDILSVRNIFPVLIFILGLAVFAGGGYCGVMYYNILTLKKEIKAQQLIANETQKTHDVVKAELDSLGVNIDYVRSTLISYNHIYKNNNMFLSTLSLLSKSLPKDLYFEKIEYDSVMDLTPLLSLPLSSLNQTFLEYETNKGKEKKGRFNLKFIVRLPVDINLRAARIKKDIVKSNLDKLFPDYSVVLTKSLMGLDQTSAISGGATEGEQIVDEEKTLEFLIKEKGSDVKSEILK
jgi:hypothetical protein